MSLDLKVSIFNSPNRCKVVVPDELGPELEHFNWALYRRFITADSHYDTNPVQSICKSLNQKTETDKTCKVRINADSFSLTKMLMKLMQSKWPLMPLGQFFFFFLRFSIFSQSFLGNENCIDIFCVACHCACRFDISGDVVQCYLAYRESR